MYISAWMKVYEIVKTENRFNLEISYILYVNITAFFKTKLFLKQKSFTHASVCIHLILYTHDCKTMVFFTIHD